MEVLTSARLIFTPISAADRPFLESCWDDDQMRRYLGGAMPEEKRDRVFAALSASDACWILRLGDGTPVGTGVIGDTDGDQEIGIELIADATGLGRARGMPDDARLARRTGRRDRNRHRPRGESSKPEADDIVGRSRGAPLREVESSTDSVPHPIEAAPAQSSSFSGKLKREEDTMEPFREPKCRSDSPLRALSRAGPAD